MSLHWETVSIYASRTDANFAKLALEAKGIPVMIHNELNKRYGNLQRMKIVVPKEYLKKSISVLKEKFVLKKST